MSCFNLPYCTRIVEFIVNQCRMVFCVALVCVALAGKALSQVEITTNHNDAARTGANLTENILNASNVNVSDFSKLFTRTVDGEIYAQPLYLSQVLMTRQGTHNVVYVATEHDSLYAFDADDPNASTPLWQVSLGTPVPSQDVCTSPSSGCPYNDLVPEIGITATPVIDVADGTIYVVAKTKTTSHHNASYHFKLHALDVASGAEKFGGPVEISASGFNPLYHLSRPGLLLLNGVVYIGFGSVGDINSWHGWVMGYNASTLQQIAVFNSTAGGNGGSIWAAGQGLAADAGNIYVMSANGSFDANSGGRDYGDSVLRLSTSSGLSLADYFTPDNQSFLSGNDVDLGSGGPMLLPGTNLLVGIGKDGVARLINTTNMGGFNALLNNDVQEFTAVAGSCGGVRGVCFMGAPVYWDSPSFGPAIYLWGSSDYLKAFKFNGKTFQTTPASQGAILDPTGLSNTVPLSLSANGSQAGTGIVWASAPYSEDANSGAVPGILYAFDAGDLSHELWDSKQNAARDDVGNYAKFSPPTIANGKVYVPTFSGQLVVYGLTVGDFSVKADPDVIVPAGPSVSTTVKVIPQASALTSPVSLSCSDPPAGTKCKFTPASLPPGSGTMQSTLTLTVSSIAAGNGGPQKFWPATWLWLGCLCVGAVPLTGRRRRQALWLLAMGVTSAGLMVAFGCGGAGTSPTPAVSSALPVLPVGKVTVLAASGGIEHKSTITLGAH